MVTMRLHTLLGRLALPVAMIGITGLGAAAPAQAAPDPAASAVMIVAPTRVVTTDGRVKSVPFEVLNVGDVEAKGIVVEYNGADSKIDPSVGFVPPAGCDADSCEVGDLAPGTRKRYNFTVDPTADLPSLGSSFDLTVHDGSGSARSFTPITVVRTAKGVDLEIAGIDDMKIAPGKSAPIPVAVRNNGNEAVEGVIVAFPGDGQYQSFPNKYSNCVDDKELGGVVCFFEETLAPDEVLTLDESTPMSVKIAANAAGPAEYIAGVFAVGADDLDSAAVAARKSAAKRSGDRLALVPAKSAKAVDVDESELNDWDNFAGYLIKVSANPADVAAIGGAFAGKIGDTSTIQVGLRNNGPADATNPLPGGYLSAWVTIPGGLKVKKVDRLCVPRLDGEPSGSQWGEVSGHDYLCVARPLYLAKGAEARFSFTVVINDPDNDDGGYLTVSSGGADPKPDNNRAEIEVKVLSGGSGGGLPVTGAPAGLLAGGGALLLSGGAVAFVLARRRRIVTVAE
jgi:hypothetical protein